MLFNPFSTLLCSIDKMSAIGELGGLGPSHFAIRGLVSVTIRVMISSIFISRMRILKLSTIIGLLFSILKLDTFLMSICKSLNRWICSCLQYFIFDISFGFLSWLWPFHSFIFIFRTIFKKRLLLVSILHPFLLSHIVILHRWVIIGVSSIFDSRGVSLSESWFRSASTFH